MIEKFPEWKALVHKTSTKLIDVAKTTSMNKLVLDEDDIVMTIEDAANLEDRYFVKYDRLPKELVKYIKKIGGKF